ncbi:MAG TPA: hypothetical protein VHP36_07250 [Chitinispirillaceae bacterium]|nr:hypothetical protein [Chitinispirillaceae bacterium]
MPKFFERFRIVSIFRTVLKILLFAAGGFLFYYKRGKVKKSFLQNSGFIVAAIHGILLSLIAIIYRLIVALNWIIQQAR